MKKIIGMTICFFIGTGAFAEDKIDWSVCSKDLAKNCAEVTDNHEKHECLEKAGKKKVSKACLDFNHSLEGKFKEKHKKHDDH